MYLCILEIIGQQLSFIGNGSLTQNLSRQGQELGLSSVFFFFKSDIET